jgi:CrcB protein
MMHPLINCLAVATGGSLGALCRFGVALASARWFGTRFPAGTLLINLTGSFVLGAFLARVARGWAVPQPVQLAVTMGFLGAYTTFSTFTFETDFLLRTGATARAAAYLAASVVLGLLCVRLGVMAGQRL